MNKSYILPLAAAALLATGCSKENPFNADSEGEGQLLKSALAMDIKADALQGTRAVDDVDINQFSVIITKSGHAEPYAKYLYGEMPEVVTLPAGDYTCTATYGEDRSAEWESPYFLGKSDTFTVYAYEITSYIDPIVCTLANVKVTVDFDPSLRAQMSDDSYVEVKVGDSASLNYGLAEADSQKAGYFKHSDEISLVAVFHGTVNGVATVETKSLAGVTKGNHYKITFKLHVPGAGDATGDADANINVDAEVNVSNVECNVEIGDEPLLDDSERPTEGAEDPDPSDPSDPSDPDDPAAPVPQITGEDGLLLGGVANNGKTLPSCVLNIHSDAEGGVTAFTCLIDSDALTADELEGVGLSQNLDLVNPGNEDLIESLHGLGLLPSEKNPDGSYKYDSWAGFSDIKFDLSQFIPLLGAVKESSTNRFVLKVTDANGTTTETLLIIF